MHNTDRTQLEYGNFGPFEIDEFTFGETGIYGEQSYYGETGGMDEIEEMQWATELLAVTNEDELDQFLGNFLKKVGRRLGPAFKPVFRTVAPMLKSVAKTALPLAGGALGTAVGGPLGGMIGSKLAGAAGQMFGLEVEGLSGEDQSFEVARRVVRLGADAVQRAGSAAAAGQTSPQAMAKAVHESVRTHAPGWSRSGMGPAVPGMGARSGRWVRRGNHIIVLGA